MEVQTLEQVYRKAYNKKTADGTVVRGCIYLEKPGFNHSEFVKTKDTLVEHHRLSVLKKELCVRLRIPHAMLDVDRKKWRLLTSEKIVRKHKDVLKNEKLVPAIVEEVPEESFLEVQVEFL